ncbi:hypothetical protein pEaSNUABM9_00165 [Erwinia phage pEa_SNUABM_9]|nr:hypothetical protein pEaSNUABM9_00165 [Erwinia phage pEa_SNUABM_9]
MRNGWVKVMWVRPELDLTRFPPVSSIRNAKKAIACSIDRALGFPSANEKTIFVTALKPGQEESALKAAVTKRMCEHIERICQVEWDRLANVGSRTIANLPR